MDKFSFMRASFDPSIFFVLNGSRYVGTVFYDSFAKCFVFSNFVGGTSTGDTREEAVKNFYNYTGG